MSKLNLFVATALAAAAIATVSAAQIPSQKGVTVQQSGPALAPSASAAQTPSGWHAAAVADAPAPQATATSPAASASAVPPVWQSVPPLTSAALPEARGEVSTAGEVRIASETPRPGKTYIYRFSATVDVANVLWRSGRGYDLFSESDATWRLGVGFGYDALRLPNSLVLVVEAGFLHEPTHGGNLTPLFGNLSGSLSASTLHLGPSLRWDIVPWLAPYGRLGLLATSVSMDLDAGATAWSYQKWAGGAHLGAGVMLTIPPRNPVAFGALIEGGYWLQRDVPIQLERELPRDAIATSSARIGTLENTGPYLRVAGIMRF